MKKLMAVLVLLGGVALGQVDLLEIINSRATPHNDIVDAQDDGRMVTFYSCVNGSTPHVTTAAALHRVGNTLMLWCEAK
jgi:hypothetical protein